MTHQETILVFDIGKTNKKFFVFNGQYEIIYQQETRIEEIKDEDGYSCEDLQSLTDWILNAFSGISKKFSIAALNFSAYGASFVNIGHDGRPATPLYNYLKPFPEELHDEFYRQYGGQEKFSVETASPDLGNLNSGLQLYRIRKQRPDMFQKIKYSLHLPQYLSWLFTGKAFSDITSIGCHTALWNFASNQYHQWVNNEGIIEKLAPLFPSDKSINNNGIKTGVGLHDSSAALIPYLSSIADPFVLISTGTWCISLNPFNQTKLTTEELSADCLCYLDYKGKSVKASRLFAGYGHEDAVKIIADHFQLDANFYKQIRFDKEISNKLKSKENSDRKAFSLFNGSGLPEFSDYLEAYYEYMSGLIGRQVESTNLVLRGSLVRDIFVDGGFSKNSIYMNLLAEAFPEKKVWAATVAQSTALGAALAIHPEWNKNEIPSKLIDKALYETDKENLKTIR